MLRALLEATESGSPPVLHELALGPFPARVVVDGLAVRAVTAGPFGGEDALFRLLLGKRRGVRSQPLPPGVAVANHDVGNAHELLERFDAHKKELERQSGRAGGFGRVWAVRFVALKGVLAGVPEDVKRVVRLLDGTRDLLTLLSESPLPAALTVRVVERLLQQGALERADLEGESDFASGGTGPELREVTAPVAITGDRSWLEERATRPPQPAVVTTTTPTATTATTTTATTTATTATTTPSMTTEPTGVAPTGSPPPTVTTPPKAPTASVATTATAGHPDAVDEPLVLDRQRAPTHLAGTSTLPRPVPSPRPELQTWLGPEDEFFSHTGDAPAAAAWPLWTLAGLVVAGAVVGALVARACVG